MDIYNRRFSLPNIDEYLFRAFKSVYKKYHNLKIFDVVNKLPVLYYFRHS